jgi:anti-anti-sigma factor
MQGHDMARWHVVVTVAREGFDEVVLRVDHSPITIGGSAASDVVLAGPHVSRTHATLTVSAGRLVYRDRSSNGSFVNGQRVTEVTVGPEDSVAVPPYHLSFRLHVDEAQSTQPLPESESGPAHAASPVSAPPVSVAAVSVPPLSTPLGRSPFEMRLIKAPGDLQGRIYRFEADGGEGIPIVVGRAADAQICLELQSVSRRHAALALLPDGRWQITDGGSRNGIAVNGHKVTTATLEDGDEIAFGPDLTAMFKHRTAARGVETPSADNTLVLAHRRSSINGAVVVVNVNGRVDGYNYTEFREQVNQLIDAGNHLLILDFAHCAFCDHVGLSVVLSAKTALDKQRGGLCLVGVDDKLRDGLSLLRLDTLLAVEPDEAAAVRRLVR